MNSIKKNQTKQPRNNIKNIRLKTSYGTNNPNQKKYKHKPNEKKKKTKKTAKHATKKQR